MTARKHLKARVRERMAHTGERYAAARAHVIPRALEDLDATRPVRADRGINPGANALRVILADIGFEVDEPLALTIAGGAGIGVFQFHYANEEFSSLFLAGRHAWDDDLRFIDAAVRRLELEPIVSETGAPRTADRHLRDALQDGRPVVAWVDLAELETRAYPVEYRGGAYHVVVVRSLDDARGVAALDDLASHPVEVPIETLARARGRIAKFRHRLLRLPVDVRPPTADRVSAAINAGLDATIDAFDHPRTRNFSLDALADWSARLRGSGKDSWATVFPRGPRLWAGLASIHQYIEHYGSGGGLLRPLIAAGIRNAAHRLGDARLGDVAARYDDLGTRWTDLARAALPDAVAVLRRTRELQDLRARLYAEGGPDAAAEIAATWTETATIRPSLTEVFPLGEAATRSLLDGLAARVDAIREGEIAASEALRAAR